MNELKVPDIDAFLHEPARLRVLMFLAVLQKADFMYLLRESGMSKGNLSVQMGKLEEAGIVDVGKSLANGRPRTSFALTKKGRTALGHYKRTMQDILDALPD